MSPIAAMTAVAITELMPAIAISLRERASSREMRPPNRRPVHQDGGQEYRPLAFLELALAAIINQRSGAFRDQAPQVLRLVIAAQTSGRKPAA